MLFICQHDEHSLKQTGLEDTLLTSLRCQIMWEGNDILKCQSKHNHDFMYIFSHTVMCSFTSSLEQIYYIFYRGSECWRNVHVDKYCH